MSVSAPGPGLKEASQGPSLPPQGIQAKAIQNQPPLTSRPLIHLADHLLQRNSTRLELPHLSPKIQPRVSRRSAAAPKVNL